MKTKIKDNKFKKINNTNYYDITDTWIKHRTINKGIIKDAISVTIDGKTFKVNKQNKITHENNEILIAKWLTKNLGGILEYLPNIKEEEGVQCADYLYKKEFWDLKELNGNGKRTLEDAIKRKKKQAHNFIIDITNSKMSKEELLKQAINIYDSKSLKWVNKLILKKNNELIAILKRKK